MFLDIKGTISEKSPGFSIDAIRNALIGELTNARVKTSVNQNGDIEWKGSYYVWPGEVIPRMFAWSNGKIIFEEQINGGIDISYYVSMPLFQLLCISFTLVFLIYGLVGSLELNMVYTMSFLIWLGYGLVYLITKSWFKGFIKRQIHKVR